jgi:DivIVA domain-containing protein
MRCLECGAEIAEQAQVCARCGAWAPVEYQLYVAEDPADAARDAVGGPAPAASHADTRQQRPESKSDPEDDRAELTEWVQTRKFSTTRLRPGYAIDEVDAFLDKAELRLADLTGIPLRPPSTAIKSGLYADPGGQAGLRYWDGKAWSPLLPVDVGGGRQAPIFPGEVSWPLPQPDGSWQYAARQAREKTTVAIGSTIAAAVLGGVAATPGNLWWAWFAVTSAVLAFDNWKNRRFFVKLDRAASGRAGQYWDSAAGPR